MGTIPVEQAWIMIKEILSHTDFSKEEWLELLGKFGSHVKEQFAVWDWSSIIDVITGVFA